MVMRVYHFRNEKWGISCIRDQRLKVARINQLNDPFEFGGVDLSHPEDRSYFKKFKDNMNANSGIICFSENWRSPVQWSHYGDNHKGLCLGFDIPDISLHKVKYNRKVTPFNRNSLIGNISAQEKMMIHCVTTKFTHWKYEREWRMFVDLTKSTADSDDRYFVDFSKNLRLAEVIVGACSDITRQQLEMVLGNRASSVNCQKARLAFRSFNVVRQRDASLWL